MLHARRELNALRLLTTSGAGRPVFLRFSFQLRISTQVKCQGPGPAVAGGFFAKSLRRLELFG
jgi:hypothetical protein